jgi:hypothetical protein
MSSISQLLPMVVVCGAELTDFALYFALSRLRSKVCWLLPDWVDEFRKARDEREDSSRPLSAMHPADDRDDFNLRHFAQALLSATEFHAIQIQFVSASVKELQIRDIVDCLDAAAHWGKGRIKALAKLPSGIGDLLEQIQVAFNTDNYAVPVNQHLSENMALGFFPTPKPKGFTHVVPDGHRWITELRIDGSLYPRHPALGEWLIKDHRLGTQGARTGSRGLCYFCPSPIYFGGDIDTILIRPTVYLPRAEEMAEHLARAAGWTTQLSDKGFYSRDTVRKFSGLEAAAEFLRAPHKRSVLDEFLRPKPQSSELIPRGIYLRSDQRWYIDYKTIADFAGESEATSLLDMLVSNEILHRGVILKCQYCRNTAWFALGEVAAGFRCKRCRREQQILSRHALLSPDPVWYYALDEIVYQGIRSDMDVPLLALDVLRRQSSSFVYMDEIEVREPEAPKPFIEIDLWCIPDGVLTIGEAKKTERINGGGKAEIAALTKYCEVATAFGARQFVLATSQTWADQTVLNARATFKDTSISVLVLDRSELLKNE